MGALTTALYVLPHFPKCFLSGRRAVGTGLLVPVQSRQHAEDDQLLREPAARAAAVSEPHSRERAPGESESCCIPF
jgi:hypothetical protein